MMIISGIAILMAIGLTLLMMRREHGDAAQLRGARTPLIKVGIQIICGDCSGDYDKPRRTCLDIFGRCEECGGTSYVLASAVAMSTANYNQQPYTQSLGSATGGRILPFHPAASKRSASPSTGEVANAAFIADKESAIAAG